MENPLITLGRPIRWVVIQFAAFMMGIGMNSPAETIRNLRDPEVKRQHRANRDAARLERALSKVVCDSTDPAARAMTVRLLDALSQNSNSTTLPSASVRLRSIVGRVGELINDTRCSSLTPGQERNVFERTSRKFSFMRICAGSDAVLDGYIEEHHAAVNDYCRIYGQSADDLLRVLRIMREHVTECYGS